MPITFAESEFRWPPMPNLRFDRYIDIYNIVPTENYWYVAFWLICYSCILFKLHKAVTRVQRIRYQYYLTDIAVGIFCLLPSYYLTPYIMMADPKIYERASGLFTLTGLSIIGGIWALMILSLPEKGAPLPTASSHALSILSGAFIGWLGLFATAILFPMVNTLFRVLNGMIEWPWPQFTNATNYLELFEYVPLDNRWYLFYWALSSAAIGFWVTRRALREELGNYRYYITDIWALILALIPIYLMIPYLYDTSRLSFRALGLLPMLILSTGEALLAVFFILSKPDPNAPIPGRWARMIWIVGCGLFGVISLLITSFLFRIEESFWLNYFLMFIFFSCPPLGILLVVCFYIFYKSFQNFREA